MQEDKQRIIKEEGSKEDRQEGGDVNKMLRINTVVVRTMFVAGEAEENFFNLQAPTIRTISFTSFLVGTFETDNNKTFE